VTIKLDSGDLVSMDDPARVRRRELEDVHPEGVPDELVELVRKGKTQKAIKRYRALNGATLDEAKAAIAKLS
jgi:ribosomal protein L7/L12